jgi:two-component system sensor histidine kinase KdpD
LFSAMPAALGAADRANRARAARGLRRPLNGALASVALLAAVTGAIELLKPHVPVLSLGVLYVFAVLPVAVVWGLAYAVAVAIASMLAFNFFFLLPLYTFTLADSRNWFALAVFVVTAIVVSELAARARRQARESALLAAIATSLLRRGQVSADLERIATEAAQALQVERARIELDDRPSATATEEPFPLAVEGRRVGTIYLERPRQGGAPARRRLLPALASLLGVAIDRERLAREALEAEALRRSDAMKTAVLRAVSHDLRTPLMAILTSASALAREDLELGRDDRSELAETILGEAERLDRLVLTPEELQARLRAGKVYPKERAEVALQNFFRHENLATLRELALREVAEDVEARRHTDRLEPLSQQAIAERILALVEPQPKSQRILRRAWRSSQRLGAEIDALWMRPNGREPTPEEETQLAALRRVASLLGIHFLEVEGDDLVEIVHQVARERGSTYIFVGTPDESRRREIFGGSLLSRMVREIPGIDIRVIADRALKEESPK